MMEQEQKQRMEVADAAGELARKIGKGGFDVVLALGAAFAAGLEVGREESQPKQKREE